MPPRLDTRSPEFLSLVTLTALAVVPLWVGRFVPLFDYPAHLIVPAAMLHANDPAMRIAELYESNPGLNPNSLHYAFTYVVAHVVPLEVASKLFLSLAVAALPWAMVFALVTFGRDWRLAFVAAPLCLGRGFWYGFVGHCAALPLSLVVLALVHRQARTPTRGQAVALGVAMLALPFAHFFTMLVTFAAAVVVAVRERRPTSALPALTGPLVMVPWFVSALQHPSARPVMDGLPFALWGTPRDLFAMLQHWFMDAYAHHGDEAVALVMVVTLALLYLWPSLARGLPTASTPLVLGVLFALGYFVLPFELHRPFEWWAMNVRLVPLAFLWLVIAAPVAALSGRGRALVVVSQVVAAAWFIGVAVDFRQFNTREAGLGVALEQIPKGSVVLGLYTNYRAPMHYLHAEHFYASAYSVVGSGGVFAPFTSIPQAWRNPKHVPPHPPGGDAALFRFEEHARGVTHFLVRWEDAPGNVADPLASRPEVRQLVDAPPWRLYTCTGACGEVSQGQAGGVAQ